MAVVAAKLTQVQVYQSGAERPVFCFSVSLLTTHICTQLVPEWFFLYLVQQPTYCRGEGSVHVCVCVHIYMAPVAQHNSACLLGLPILWPAR